MFLPMPVKCQAIIHTQIARALMDLGHEVWLVLWSSVVSTGGFNMDGMNLIEYPVLDFETEITYPTVLEPLYEGRKPNLRLQFQLLEQN
ncbi:hypothetical protein BaRGS_00023557 [Batillaria attramentaria]|uniref:Glucuronosyltransferase n=1 Tax=Batillaria attramentaria TaxID=370345 RepID=A0ABD0KDS9_9CAEN